MSSWYRHKDPPFQSIKFIVQCPHQQFLAYSILEGMFKYKSSARKWKSIYYYTPKFNNNDWNLHNLFYDSATSRYIETTNTVRIYGPRIPRAIYQFVDINLNEDSQELKIFDIDPNDTFDSIYYHRLNSLRFHPFDTKKNRWDTRWIPNLYSEITKKPRYSSDKTHNLSVQVKALNPHVIVSEDERYLMCFGGRIKEDSEWPLLNNIVVIDTRKDMLWKSSIITPCTNFVINIVRDQIYDQLLVHGYINNLWKQHEFRNTAPLSIALITLITHWMRIEIIHLIGEETEGKKCKHWSIDIDTILQSIIQ